MRLRPFAGRICSIARGKNDLWKTYPYEYGSQAQYIGYQYRKA